MLLSFTDLLDSVSELLSSFSEQVFCMTTKSTFNESTLCNSQVKDNKIDLLVQHYEQFTILEEESINSGLARFNTIITSLKALDEGFSSKNYVRKFLRALHPKWREKVTAIEETKDLSSLALDELIGNLKVHEVVMEKHSKIYRGKKGRANSIALKANKESSDEETLTSISDDEEYAMAIRNFKKFFRRKGKFVRQPREEKKSFRQRDEKKGKSDRKCFRCGDLNHLIGNCPKPPCNKDQKAFIGVSWSDSENEVEEKTNDETCLMAQSLNEVTLNSFYDSDNASSLDNDIMQIEYDSLCEISLKIIKKNKILKSKRDLLEKEILELNEKIKKLKRSKEIDITCKLCQELKFKNSQLKETQVKFVKFDKSANSLREMLNNKNSSSCKIGLGFDSSKASTSETKPMSFVGPSSEKATDESIINVHRSTIPGSMSRTVTENMAEHVFSPHMSSGLDFVITRKKLIHNRIHESKKPSLKPYFKRDKIGNQDPPVKEQGQGWCVGILELKLCKKTRQGNGNVVPTPSKGNGNGINGNLIRCNNCRGEGHYASNCIVNPRKWDAANLQQQLQMAQLEKARIQSTQEEFEFMATADAYEETERYTELLEPIPEPHQVQHNDSNVLSAVFSVEQSGETIQQHYVNVEETRVLYDSLYNNLAIEVEKVNLVNCKVRETNADLTTELARYKNQEKYFEISQEKYDKLERFLNKRTPLMERGMNTKFAKQSILGKPPSSSRPKLYAVTLLPKSKAIPKINESHALSKSVTSHSVHTPTESKVMKNDNVISPRIFRINHFKASRRWKIYSVICSTNYSNGENQVVSKSSAVTTAEASGKRQQEHDATSSISTQATTITTDGNSDL
uniref:Zf-CCHC domain-containing protein/UBN2 domain-containing protein n=1 Tax=Tanacetum cinerariifolium TaxID=118510 RepID=A0A699GL26_TANCI|nr:zf-CCHC domain-containing protein/UBN2 domain-containing protein [Tanacetum cinerariifolium]